jgi:hypothetical protein
MCAPADPVVRMTTTKVGVSESSSSHDGRHSTHGLRRSGDVRPAQQPDLGLQRHQPVVPVGGRYHPGVRRHTQRRQADPVLIKQILTSTAHRRTPTNRRGPPGHLRGRPCGAAGTGRHRAHALRHVRPDRVAIAVGHHGPHRCQQAATVGQPGGWPRLTPDIVGGRYSAATRQVDPVDRVAAATWLHGVAGAVRDATK